MIRVRGSVEAFRALLGWAALASVREQPQPLGEGGEATEAAAAMIRGGLDAK